MSHERKTTGTHEISSDLSKSEQKQAEGDHPEARQDGRVRPGFKSSSQAAGAAAAIKGKTTKSSGKDRHSKVNTARGPRDRRVRLSVSTAIQFYDIQDRLGFDQPSKAIEWLLRKAKPAIDELNQRPPAPLSIGQAAAGKKPLLKSDESLSTSNQVLSAQPALLQGTSDERSLHELELVRGGSRVKVSRDRDRDRVNQESRREMTELPHHHQEVPYTAPSMPANVYESGGGSPSPVCSSFTQLLQSPFPSSLQNFIHSSSSHQTLLQNQLLQGLYHHQPAAQASFFPSGGASSTFQRFGGPHHGAHQEVDFMQSPASAAAEQAASEGGPAQQAAGAFFSESQTHKSYPHSSFHNSPGGGGSTGVNLPWTMPPSSQHVIIQQQQQQQQQHSLYNYRSSNPSAAAATGVYNYALDHTRHLQPAQPSFYLVPARIQGIGLEDELQQQQQQQQQQHQQQKRPRQGE